MTDLSKLTHQKVEVWLLFVNLPTCTHPSVAQTGPSWFWSDPVHWYNNNHTSYTHLLPNPTSANNLHSHKLQLPRHPPLNQSTDMTAIHRSNINHNRLKPNNHTPSTAQPKDRESREPISFIYKFQDVNFIKTKEGQKRYHKLNVKTA